MNAPLSILLVDDERDILDLLALALIQMGLHPIKATTLAEARQQLLSGERFALCLTDLRLPDGEGTALLETLQQHRLDIPLAVITAHGSQSSAIEAMKRGAFDYLNKPIGLDQLRALVKSVIHITPSTKESGRTSTNTQNSEPGLLGNSAPILQVREHIRRFAASHAPVHIHGESGSGKERAARLIHALSRRAHGPFVAVNCGALTESLMESEFFGHRKGAFTGADRDHVGFFQAAQSGTLFLDEIAELPLSMQVKLLRAIQEKSVRRVGSTEETPVDVRLLSATHRPLKEWVEQGLFRQDLYYRINVIELNLPPLRELRDDILLIAHAILERLAPNEPITLTTDAQQTLLSYPFPGNVRELENLLERALALRTTPNLINTENLGLFSTNPPLSTYSNTEFAVLNTTPSHTLLEIIAHNGSLERYLDTLECQALQAALETTEGNRTAAAQLLGITFRSMRYRLDRLNLAPQESSEVPSDSTD